MSSKSDASDILDEILEDSKKLAEFIVNHE